MSAYYSENDPFAAAWLRELIKENLIAPGEVDERSIEEVRADDLRGFTQCHFFAGIGVWSYALRAAGWPDDTAVWTGSCPCQGFSASGKREGFSDKRHLWPTWFRLIRECRPPVIFGEQVSSSLALGSSDGIIPEVFSLWEREAVLRILENWLQENAADGLQGLSERGGAGMAQVAARLFNVSSGEPTGVWCEGAITGEGYEVRPDAAMDSGAIRSGLLRSDGATVRSDSTEGVELAIAGSDRSEIGIRADEYEGGAFFIQRWLRQLGRAEIDRSGESLTATAARQIGEAIERTRRELEEADGCAWFDIVQLDMENEGYAIGAIDTCAAGVGAPHIRQRLYFVADSVRTGRAERWAITGNRSLASRSESGERSNPNRRRSQSGWTESAVTDRDARNADLRSASPELRHAIVGSDSNGGDAGTERLQRSGQQRLRAEDSQSRVAVNTEVVRRIRRAHNEDAGRRQLPSGHSGETRDGDNTNGSGPRARQQTGEGVGYGSSVGPASGTINGEHAEQSRLEGFTGNVREWRGPGWLDPHTARSVAEAGATRGAWADCDWWYGRDGKYRPIGPGLFPLAASTPGRVGRLRGYGNALCAPQAIAFIESYMSLS